MPASHAPSLRPTGRAVPSAAPNSLHVVLRKPQIQRQASRAPPARTTEGWPQPPSLPATASPVLPTGCDCCCLQAASPTPIFGASSTFGGTGFGGFAAAAAATGDAPAAAAAAEGGDDDEAAAEEECKAEFQPVVQLDEVEVSTGEEDEEALFDA